MAWGRGGECRGYAAMTRTCPCHVCELERALALIKAAMVSTWIAPRYKRRHKKELAQLGKPEARRN